MSFFLNNAHFLSITLLLILFFITLIQVRQYLRNRKIMNVAKFLIICRVIAVLIIIVFFIQPIFYITETSDEKVEFSVYIDNSESMKNNISLSQIRSTVSDIQEWILNSGYSFNLNLIGDNIKSINNFDYIDFSDSVTNFDSFRNHIINKESDNFLLIADGNSPIVGLNHQYNFNKKVNVLGVGDRIVVKTNLDKAYISKEDDDFFINIKINNEAIHNDLELDFFQNNNLLDSYKINSFSDSLKLEKININYLGLNDYNDLKVILKNSKSEIDRVNVLSNSLKDLKPIVLMSGGLSLNSRYVLNRLNELFDLKVEFFYRIGNEWNNLPEYEYDKIGMLIFDNYPNSYRDLENFNKIVNSAEENNIPIMVICGAGQRYELLDEISDLFLFEIKKTKVNRKLKENSRFNKYSLSDFYVIQDSSLFSIECSKNIKNLKYDDESSAICYLDNKIIMFYPNISKIAYKTFEFNNEASYFNDFIGDIFKDSYYGDGDVELFTRKDQFYNNEKIKVELLNRSGVDLEGAKLYKDNDNSRQEIPINKAFTISEPGEYDIKLIDVQGRHIGKTIQIKIENFLNESKLEGQGYRFLFDISNESGGLYFDYSSGNIIEYLNKMKNNQDINNHKSYYKIDFKDYLFLLILSIFMLSIEWFFRKRRGLL